MRNSSLVVATVLSAVLSGFTPPVAAGEQASGSGKTRAQLVCEKACHDDHRRWVDLCLANHNPREITPSARGQCVDAGAERLRQCLGKCR